MGIAIHNLSTSGEVEAAATDLSSALRQSAGGLLGTTVQLADLVGPISSGTLRVTWFLKYERALAGHPVRCGRVYVHWRCGGVAHVRVARAVFGICDSFSQ